MTVRVLHRNKTTTPAALYYLLRGHHNEEWEPPFHYGIDDRRANQVLVQRAEFGRAAFPTPRSFFLGTQYYTLGAPVDRYEAYQDLTDFVPEDYSPQADILEAFQSVARPELAMDDGTVLGRIRGHIFFNKRHMPAYRGAGKRISAKEAKEAEAAISKHVSATLAGGINRSNCTWVREAIALVATMAPASADFMNDMVFRLVAHGLRVLRVEEAIHTRRQYLLDYVLGSAYIHQRVGALLTREEADRS